MRIGIDCRLYGPKHTGIGRYVQNLVEQLIAVDKDNEYILFFKSGQVELIQKSKGKSQNCNSKVKIVETDIRHYSFKEQFLLPSIINREKVDIMHFPHFNVPVFYQGKYVVTIHDLIKHSSRGVETTTRAPWLYFIKYLGYKFVFRQAVKRAEKVITPSRFVKGEVVKKYGVNPNKIVVTYEGADSKFQLSNSNFQTNQSDNRQDTKYKILNTRYKIHKPYLLYVGSVYPHKNIARLIEAIKLINNSITYHLSPITLVIVCARNVFIERLSKFVDQSKATSFVNLVGFVPDEDLAVLYKEASAFVFPTLSEGFGLPGLEAMALGCPVVCSDIPVLKEIYKDAAVYFNPLDPSDMAEKIKHILNREDVRDKMIERGQVLVKGYSWQKTAKKTLKVYKSLT